MGVTIPGKEGGALSPSMWSPESQDVPGGGGALCNTGPLSWERVCLCLWYSV